MKKQITKIALFGLIAAALAITPSLSLAQNETNAPAQTPVPKKHKATPFHGSVAAVDNSAETLTVGTLVLTIASTTKISNTTNGEPAILSDIAVGQYVSGSYLKDSEGNLTAKTIHIGKKAGKGKKHKAPADDGGASTNSVPN
jgi:hypothetical protein